VGRTLPGRPSPPEGGRASALKRWLAGYVRWLLVNNDRGLHEWVD
jgi:hypothetical protein